MMFRLTALPVNASISFFRASTPAPPRPMTMPGLAVWMVTLTLLALRSISIEDTPEASSFSLSILRSL